MHFGHYAKHSHLYKTYTIFKYIPNSFQCYWSKKDIHDVYIK